MAACLAAPLIGSRHRAQRPAVGRTGSFRTPAPTRGAVRRLLEGARKRPPGGRGRGGRPLRAALQLPDVRRGSTSQASRGGDRRLTRFPNGPASGSCPRRRLRAGTGPSALPFPRVLSDAPFVSDCWPDPLCTCVQVRLQNIGGRTGGRGTVPGAQGGLVAPQTPARAQQFAFAFPGNGRGRAACRVSVGRLEFFGFKVPVSAFCPFKVLFFLAICVRSCTLGTSPLTVPCGERFLPRRFFSVCGVFWC